MKASLLQQPFNPDAISCDASECCSGKVHCTVTGRCTVINSGSSTVIKLGGEYRARGTQDRVSEVIDTLFISNFVHIPVSDDFSFVKIICPPDRWGISRS